jgi:integrase
MAGRKRKKRRNRSGPYRRPDREGWWARVGGRWWRSDAEDESEAKREWEAAVEAARARPLAFGDEPPTVGDALSAFLADVKAERAAQFNWYDCKLREFAASIDPDLPLSELRPLHVLSWLSRKGGSSTNRYNCGRAVRGAIGWYCVQARLGESLLKGIKLPRPGKKFYVFPPWAAVLAVSLIHSRRKWNPHFPEFAGLIIATGARPSEICRVRGMHVDPDGSMIRLPTGKQGARTIPIPRGMRAMVARLKVQAGPNRWLTPNAKGKQQTKSGWMQAWRRVRVKLGLPAEATIYQWRHTWATYAAMAGVPLAVIAQAMGTSIKVISSNYAHLAATPLDRWKEQL